MKSAIIIFATIIALQGCARLETADRSLLNQSTMDLSGPNILGQPSPSSGLRNQKKGSGGEACSVCAH
jgi:hypothetical protein